ncbi:MAG: hypothetical protein Q4G52_10690 [Clostridia bacterium]|nr:hypothetical protein [Clostridia bacterium]
MRRKLSLELTQDTLAELAFLSESLGFSEELTAEYAIRLVSACVREGLLTDVPARAWPKEAQLLRATGAQGKVLAFSPRREERAKARRKTEIK